MRMLIVAPAFGDADFGTYLREVLDGIGVQTDVFAYALAPRRSVQRDLVAACRAFKPTAILGLKLDGIEPDTLRRMRRGGARLVLWYVDCFGPAPPAWLLARMRECDAAFVTAKGMVPMYRQLLPIPVHWLMEGVHLPAFPRLEVTAGERRLFGSDVAFVGSVYHPTTDPALFHGRARLLRAVHARHDLKIWGLQRYERRRTRRLPIIEWPAYNRDLVRICRSSRIVLGMNLVNSIELYFSNRTFLTLAAGGFHLTHYVPGLETMFRNHEHLVWYHSTGECLELIDHYLARPARAAAIAERGRTFVRRRFSMARQVRRMLELANLSSPASHAARD